MIAPGDKIHLLTAPHCFAGAHTDSTFSPCEDRPNQLAEMEVGTEGRPPLLISSTATPYSALTKALLPDRHTHVLCPQLCSVASHCEHIWIVLFGDSRRRGKALSSFLLDHWYLAKRSPVIKCQPICCNWETQSLSSSVGLVCILCKFRSKTCFVCFVSAEPKEIHNGGYFLYFSRKFLFFHEEGKRAVNWMFCF